MSQTVQIDPVLAQLGATAPPQDIVLDPQFGSIRMVTPIGRLSYVNLASPKQIKQADGSMGQPIFSSTILMNPAACGDLYRAIIMVGANRFQPEQRPDPQNPSQMVTMSADADPNSGLNLFFLGARQGGLHYPLRLGDENFMRDPQRYADWRGLYFLNVSIPAKNAQGNSQQPVCKDENGRDCDPSKLYSGCYGRMQITFFAFPKAGTQGRGTRGVGVTLNAVQFARHGERMGGFDASKAAESAFAGAGAIPVDPANPPGYGPHAASLATVPPGAFAAPGAPIPPNTQPRTAAPMPGFARPPGV
jgi:hypothetical protein